MISQSVTPFEFESHLLRTVLRDGDPWFYAVDVCDALGLENATKALLPLDPDEKSQLVDSATLTSIQGTGINNLVNIVNESGLYTLILRCRDAIKPGTTPHRFRKWITSEVLPQIRKTGAYSTTQTTGDALVQMALAYKAHEDRILSVEYVQQLLANEHAKLIENQEQLNSRVSEMSGGDLYVTVRGYAKTHKLPGDTNTLARVGRRATKKCKLHGIRIGVVADERHGVVNSYPPDILEEAFDEVLSELA